MTKNAGDGTFLGSMGGNDLGQDSGKICFDARREKWTLTLTFHLVT